MILLPVGFVFAATLALYRIKGLSPFGSSSLVWDDAYFQYTYYLCYLKDVFAGKNSVLYSFSNGLGKTDIGLWAYYLNSPVNLFLPFVEKSQMTAFIDVSIALKMAVCAGTMGYFLSRRFEGRISHVIQILLSCSYAWSVYNWSQCSNFMWLDGVYILPLMLLGVYKVVRENNGVFLAVSVAVSIIVQWYTAGINCLFAIIWFFFELALMSAERNPSSVSGENTSPKQQCLNKNKGFLRFCFGKTIMFGSSMLTGVLLSALLFWPVILDLRGGKGTFDWDILKPAFRGNVLSTLKYNIIGGISTDFVASLFCGSLVVLGLMGLFINRYIRWRIKLAFVFMLILSVLLYYWQPLYGLFSLLKRTDSYFYRYSYVSSAFMIMGAAYYFAQPEKERNIYRLFAVSIGYGVMLCAIYLLDDQELPGLVFCTSLMTILTGVCIFVSEGKGKIRRNIGLCFLFMISMIELLWNGFELSTHYCSKNADFSDAYNVALEQQIQCIKEIEEEFCRFTQTSSKELQHQKENISASYSNALGFGYAGIASYSSCPDLSSLKFLDKAGYRSEADCITVVNTSIIPLDSLLGVRYVLSPYDINGYEKIWSPDEITTLATYRNPFALPMAFVVQYADKVRTEKNPFEFVNDVYTSLNGGKTTRVFVPVEHEVSRTDKTITYTITGQGEGTLLYGNIPMVFRVPEEMQNFQEEQKLETVSMLDVNGYYTQGYSQWLSPSVFLIPTDGGQSVIKQKISDFEPQGPAQFYKVDFTVLESIATEFRKLAADTTYDMHDRSIHLQVAGNKGKKLFLSVPWNAGWTASVNGKKVPIEKAVDTFMLVPLSEGDNQIVLFYHVPGTRTGFFLTIVGLVMLWFLWRKQSYSITEEGSILKIV